MVPERKLARAEKVDMLTAFPMEGERVPLKKFAETSRRLTREPGRKRRSREPERRFSVTVMLMAYVCVARPSEGGSVPSRLLKERSSSRRLEGT